MQRCKNCLVYAGFIGNTVVGNRFDSAKAQIDRKEMSRFAGSGADPNLTGADWVTPLSWARKKQLPEIESPLLAAGADA